MMYNMELKDKIVLVAGGGSGIGLGTARALLAEGCRVALCGRSETTLRQAAATLNPNHQIRWKTCDVADRGQVQDLLSWLQSEWGAPSILVNSAGINIPKRMMANVDPADFDRVLAVNTTGAFNLFHAVLPGMRTQGEGLIINIVSIAGQRPLALAGLPYSASKFAQSALGTYVNLEESRHGIRLTNIYPGEVNTPIVDKRPEPPPPDKRAQMLQPEDIATCVVTIAKLPPRAIVSDLVIIPPYQTEVI
jgi:NADP-dependent 3-hydroxy acid dehydrogenase YdfG